tara:strand:+ start:66 stop:488 length:423 start_codon:yes stop_codon:yes gene_type:complete
MKITKQQLKQIIKEEISSIIEKDDEDKAEDEEVEDKKKKSKKKIDLHGFDSEEETAKFVKDNPSFFNEELRDYVRGQSRSPDVEVPGGGVRSVKGVKSSIMDSLEDAIQAAQRGDFETVATRVANLEAFVKALKKVGEIK